MSADVELSDVSVTFGSFYAAKNVNVKVNGGEFLSFLGPSGCGKTTLLRAISGFQEPSEGKVLIDNKDMSGIGPNKRPTALIFQNLALFPLMSVSENIAFSLEVRGVSKEERKKRVEEGRYVVRLAIPENKRISAFDEIRGELTFDSNELEDKVILKSDGMPTYHLANVVDDNDMKITSVVRGEEWLSSLPVHYLLYEFFGWKPPKFYHLPLILKTSGAGKLSKRDADEQGHPIFAVKWEDSNGFKEHGFIPEGLNNYLALLGWSNKEEKERYTMEELVESFNYEEINKSGARFDFKKALWINHLHLKDLESKRILDLSEQTKKLLVEKYSEPEAIEIIELVKERLNTTKDIDKELSVFIKQPKEIDVSAIEKINREVIFSVLNFCKLNSELVNSPFELKNELMKFGAENDISFGNIMKTLRLSLVGSLSGPDLFKIIDFIGPEETLQRIENLINKI